MRALYASRLPRRRGRLKARYFLIPAAAIAATVLFRDALRPFFAALAAAFVLDLPTRRLERCFSGVRSASRRRALACSAALLGTAVITALAVSLLVPRIAESAAALRGRLPGYLETLRTALRSLPVPEALRGAFGDRELALAEELFGSGSALLARIWNVTRDVGGAVASSLADVFTSFVCCLYMLFGKHAILRQCRALLAVLLPPAPLRYGAVLLKTVNEVFSRYVTARFVESFLLFLLSLIGLTLARIPYAPLLSLVVGVSDLIPFLGPVVGTLSCFLLLVVIRPLAAVWFFLFTAALQFLDNHVIAPHVVGGSVGLPAFWSVSAILLGARIAGGTGAFLALPLAAAARELLLPRAAAGPEA